MIMVKEIVISMSYVVVVVEDDIVCYYLKKVSFY